MSSNSVSKYNSYFKQHLARMLAEETRQKLTGKLKAPKYSMCFLDLAEIFGLKHEAIAEASQIIEGETLKVKFEDKTEDRAPLFKLDDSSSRHSTTEELRLPSDAYESNIAQHQVKDKFRNLARKHA